MSQIESPFDRALQACNGELERNVCHWVEKRLKQLEQGAYEILPALIARDMKVSDDVGISAIINALNILSLSSVGVLQRIYEWRELDDNDDVLGMPVLIKGSEIAEAFRRGGIESPVTGVFVEHFTPHIHLAYHVRKTEK